MNHLDYSSDSDSDKEQPKSTVKIVVEKPVVEEYQRNFKPTQTSSLLDLLSTQKPVAAQKTLGSGTGLAMSGKEGSRIVLERPIKKQRVEEKQKPTEEATTTDFDFFSLSSDPIVKDRVVGPSRPTFEDKKSVQQLPRVEKVETKPIIHKKEEMDEDLKKLVGHKDKHGTIKVQTFSVKDEIVPYSAKPTIDSTLLINDSFSKLDKDYIPDGMNRNNNLMALAQQAKMQSAEFEQRKAERAHVKRQVRQKYGW